MGQLYCPSLPLDDAQASVLPQTDESVITELATTVEQPHAVRTYGCSCQEITYSLGLGVVLLSLSIDFDQSSLDLYVNEIDFRPPGI